MADIRFLDDHGGTLSSALVAFRNRLARMAATDASGERWVCLDDHERVGDEDVFDVRIWPLADWREELSRQAPAENIVAEFAERLKRRARAAGALEKSDAPCPDCGAPLEIVQRRLGDGPPLRYVRCTSMMCGYGAQLPRLGLATVDTE
jgi:hypothetical protein